MIRGMLVARRIRTALVALAAACALGWPGCGGRDRDRRPVILAATTSTQDSGVLDVLVPAFEADSGWRVRTVALAVARPSRSAVAGRPTSCWPTRRPPSARSWPAEWRASGAW